MVWISVDPGPLNWIDSLLYDINEGESIILRILVITATSSIVSLPLLADSQRVVITYLVLLFPMLVLGLSFRFINGQFSSWEASLVINEFSFAGGAISEFSNIFLIRFFINSIFIKHIRLPSFNLRFNYFRH